MPWGGRVNFDFSPAIARLEVMINEAIAGLPNLLVGLLVFGLFYIAARSIRLVVHRFNEQRRRDRNVSLALGRLAYAGVLFIGIMLALVILLPQFTPTRLIELLGVGSIAIGFALRDILQNFLAGLLILVTEPFRIGDQIVVNTFEGTVEDIHMRATSIRTYDGRRVVIPNANLFTDSVIVNTAFEKRRLEYDIGIGYDVDIRATKDLMLGAIRGIEGVLVDPAPDAIVVDLADFVVKIRIRWWIQPPKRANALDMRDHVLIVVKETLESHGIDLRSPQLILVMPNQDEETNRRHSR